jgi:hypothetical protein
MALRVIVRSKYGFEGNRVKSMYDFNVLNIGILEPQL